MIQALSQETRSKTASKTQGMEKEGRNEAAATAAAAKSLQSCPTLCDPIDGSPPGSSVQGIFQARVLVWGKNESSNKN